MWPAQKPAAMNGNYKCVESTARRIAFTTSNIAATTSNQKSRLARTTITYPIVLRG